MTEKLNQSGSTAKKSIGMVDVARHAGVSPATVSRVINANPTVDSKIREHVWETIRQLKYRPHHAARNLPRGQTGNLAVATPRTSRILFGNPFFSRIFEGIGEALDESHYNMLISTTTPQLKRLLDAHTVDGFLLCAVRKGDPYLEELEAMDLPVVVIGAYGANTSFTTFAPDYVGGTAAEVEYLAKLGHTRIGHLNGPPNSYKSEAGQRGFREAVSRLGLIETGSMLADEFIEHEGYTRFMERKASGKEIPTAYVASSDYLAIGVLKAAIDLGMKIPQELSVVGFGDIPFAALFNPPLTTIHGDLMEMGYEAAQTLISMVNGGSRAPRRVVFPMKIIERGTAVPPSNG
jgi:LacI family transcriptional regulator